MLRAWSSRVAIVASSGSVGVANVRKTDPPHFSHVTASGTALSKDRSLPHVRHTSVTSPCVPFLSAMKTLALDSMSERCKTHAERDGARRAQAIANADE